MKILMISSYLPYPLFSGGAVRLYNLIKEISQEHDITLVCEIRDHQTEDDVKEVKKFCKKIITVKRQKQWSLRNIVKSGLSFMPFLLVGHTTPAFQNSLYQELISEDYDLIHIETFYVMQNLPFGKKKLKLPPIVLAEHNLEYKVYGRYIDRAPYFLRPFFSIDVSKIYLAEKKSWSRADAVVFVSEDEKKQSGLKDSFVVRNGVNVSQFVFKGNPSTSLRKEKKILFIGDFKWVQNQDAGEWIVKELWRPVVQRSELSAQENTIKLWMVGKNIPESLRSVADESVIFDDGQDDTSKVFAEAFALLAPIRVGGGTSFKILEAMASGCPVITTRLGNEGINAEDGKSILIAETKEEFAQAIEKLISDEKLYDTIRKNARKLIEEKFDWKEIAKELEKVYAKVVS